MVGIVSDFTDQCALNITWNSSSNGVNKGFDQLELVTRKGYNCYLGQQVHGIIHQLLRVI